MLVVHSPELLRHVSCRLLLLLLLLRADSGQRQETKESDRREEVPLLAALLLRRDPDSQLVGLWERLPSTWLLYARV